MKTNISLTTADAVVLIIVLIIIVIFVRVIWGFFHEKKK